LKSMSRIKAIQEEGDRLVIAFLKHDGILHAQLTDREVCGRIREACQKDACRLLTMRNSGFQACSEDAPGDTTDCVIFSGGTRVIQILLVPFGRASSRVPLRAKGLRQGRGLTWIDDLGSPYKFR
jgi:hypothetical protein